VFFFQKSFEATRMVGLMQMLPRADEFLARLEPWDRVAVVSYDLHLKLWMDFSLDRDALGRILGHDLLMANPPPFDVAPAPSLFAQLAPAQARRVASPEDALKAVADALWCSSRTASAVSAWAACRWSPRMTRRATRSSRRG
jgi:hypothetical protein